MKNNEHVGTNNRNHLIKLGNRHHIAVTRKLILIENGPRIVMLKVPRGGEIKKESRTENGDCRSQ